MVFFFLNHMIQRIIIHLILSHDIMQNIFDVWHHNVLVCLFFSVCANWWIGHAVIPHVVLPQCSVLKAACMHADSPAPAPVDSDLQLRSHFLQPSVLDLPLPVSLRGLTLCRAQNKHNIPLKPIRSPSAVALFRFSILTCILSGKMG